MRWCERCRAAARHQRDASIRKDAVAVSMMLLDLAHAADVVDALEDDVPESNDIVELPVQVVEVNMEKCPVHAGDAEPQQQQLLVPAQQLLEQGEQQAELEATQHMRTHRWSILRQSPYLQQVAADWWQRCCVSLSSRKGAQWSSLRVLGSQGKRSQQRDAHTIPTTVALRTSTETAVRRVLSSIGVAADALHCCAMKVLRSPPGAARQKLHYDVPVGAMLSDPSARGQGVSRLSAHKGPQCISAVLHLNPETTRGTHVPIATAAEMASLYGSESPSSGAESDTAASNDRRCNDSNFVSHDMLGGDLLVFFDDVAHYGPANVSLTEWRWVLFVMFSPEEGPDQDNLQTFLHFI
jgi:hypothetical protein